MCVYVCAGVRVSGRGSGVSRARLFVWTALLLVDRHDYRNYALTVAYFCARRACRLTARARVCDCVCVKGYFCVCCVPTFTAIM